jgi:hypothetical protein
MLMPPFVGSFHCAVDLARYAAALTKLLRDHFQSRNSSELVWEFTKSKGLLPIVVV